MEWSRYPRRPTARRSYICPLTHADRAPSSSLLLLHWRRRLCLQVNGAWPLIDHVWSRTTPLISACSSLVCFAVPILTHVISCITRQLHQQSHTLLPQHQALASSFAHSRSTFNSLSIFFHEDVVPMCSCLFFLLPLCLSTIPLSVAAALARTLPTPAGAVGTQQVSYTALINNT